jgi:4-amino-4-deoxy-L-arabinose transferase-like glycosyltransferase
MQTTSDRAASPWLRPEFARLLAILWVVGLALVYLVRYGAWILPWQAVDLLGMVLPTFHIGPHFQEFWIARAYDFGCVVGIVVVALGLGATVTDRLVGKRDVFGALLALAVGFWLLAVLVLVAGSVSIANIPLVCLALLCWVLPAPRKFVRDFQVSTDRTDGWAKLMVACIVLAAVLNLAGALAPPFEYDELEYHLGALADYQRAGRIMFLPHNFYSNLPQLTEMLYLLATTMTSNIAAKMLHWLFGLLGAMAVFGVARRLWSRAVGLAAAALFYCTPFVQDLGQTARIDLATAFFATLAFGALVIGSEEERRDLVWLSALCAGAAVATKWTAIPVVLLPAASLLTFRREFRLLPAFGFLALAVVTPWLAKNWLLTGNPVYPLFHQWLPNPHWTASQAAVFSGKHYPTFGWGTIGQFFSLLWNYSFVEVAAVPLLLMTTPLVLLVSRFEPAAKRAGWLVAGAYVSWFCFTFRPWRFLFPAFGMAAVAGAFAMEKLGREALVRFALRLAVGVVVAASLATLVLNDLADAENPERLPPQMDFLQYALGQFTRDEFIARMGKGVLEPIVWMNENLPSDAKVLYVGESRVYYAKQPVVWSTAFDQHPLTAMSNEAKTTEELLAALRAKGVTHVYMNFAEWDRLRRGYDYMADANWDRIRDTLQHHATEVHRMGRGVVYELAKK